MLLMSLFMFFASPAHALRVACPDAELINTTPGAGQTDVAIDTAIKLMVNQPCGKGQSATGLELTLKKGDEVIESSDLFIQMPLRDGFALFQPTEELEQNTEYTLDIFNTQAGAGSTSGWQISFTTGTDRVADLSGELNASVHYAIWDKGNQWGVGANAAYATEFHLEVTAVPDPQGLSTLHLIVEGDEDTIIGSTKASPSGTIQDLEGGLVTEAPKETCVIALQRDGLNREVARSDALCPDIKRIGCSSLGTVPGLMTLFWLPGLALFRRRRPTA